MPKIEVLTTYVTRPGKGKERVYDPGSIVDVDDAEAARLIERAFGRAVETKAPSNAEDEAKAAAAAAQKAEAEAEAKAKAELDGQSAAEAAQKAEEEAKAKAEAEAQAGQLALGGNSAPGT